MITSARFVDFKGLHDVTIEPGRFTVLVGPNAVGKSSVLEGIEVVAAVAKNSLTHPGLSVPAAVKGYVLSGLWHPTHLTRTARKGFELAVRGSGSEGTFEASFEASTTSVAFTLGDGRGRLVTTRGNADATAVVGDVAGAHELASVLHLRLDASAVASTAPIAVGRPIRSADGRGFAAYLYDVNGRRDDTIERIEADLRVVVPSFSRLSFLPEAVTETLPTRDGSYEQRTLPGVVLELHFTDGAKIRAAHASEGTLLALALLAALHDGGGVSLLLLDDIDRGLHPAAQQRFVELIYRLLDRRPELQIIATTHSPDFVDACRAEDVWVMGPTREHGPKARRLTSHPRAGELLKFLRVGEFWGSVGENWVREASETEAEKTPTAAHG